jgi:pimeloyl-ACP methyl ester carboxylesterase
MSVEIENICGRYGQFEIEGVTHRLYWEEAGSGIPLICLHTAGSDGRQYRAVLNDPAVTSQYRVLVFDMPWHGKSSPPAGAEHGTYQLTAAIYQAMVLAFMDGLEIEQPVVMGCSIGGRIVLHLARNYPERFRALIGLQSSPDVPPYYDTEWLHRSDVHGGEICGAIAYGLMAPLSPQAHRDETVWHYMQGGPGIFKGDMHFYKVDGGLTDDDLDHINVTDCPLYFLSGEYDYSGTPADTRVLADRLGVDVIVMEQMGHFPMSENPERFLDYLRPVLEEIASGSS